MNEAITFQNLYVNMGNVIIKVYGLQIFEAANQHGEIQIVSVMEEAFGNKIVEENPVALLVFYIDEEEIPQSLFAGIISKIQVITEGEQYYLTVTAKASTILMDATPIKVSYQDIYQTNTELLTTIFKRGRYGLFQLAPAQRPVGEMLLQYEETDWEFIRRFASIYGVRLFPNNQDTMVQLQIGIADELVETDWDQLPFQVMQDFESYHYIQENYPEQASGWNYNRYLIYTYDLVPLGSKVRFRGQEMCVGKVSRFLNDGLLINGYTLYHRSGLWMPRLYNDKLSGISIMGNVIGIERSQVQVHFHIDGKSTPKHYHWFPYSTMAASGNGSGWYAMPAKGEQVRLFFPEGKEQSGYVVTCMASTPKEQLIQYDWDLQSIQGPSGEEVTFLKDGVIVRGQKGELILLNDGSVSIQEAASIRINGQNDVTIAAGELLQIKANQEIKMNCGSGTISMTDSATEITGGQVHFNAPEE